MMIPASASIGSYKSRCIAIKRNHQSTIYLHSNLRRFSDNNSTKRKSTVKLMERKGNNGGANNKATYEDFEPSFKWKTEADKDTLEIQVEGFKMENLKVQVTSLGKILVSGERSLDDKKLKRLRFRKDFDLKEEHNSNGIRAKFGHGVLQIIVPKVKENTTSPHQPPLPENTQDTLPDKKSSKPIAEATNDPNPVRSSNMLLRRRFGVVDRRRALWLTAVVVGAAAVGITAYLSYKYWFLTGEGINKTAPEVFPPP